MEEIWKDVVGYEGLYQVSNSGRIKRLNYNRSGKEKILKLTKDKFGYFVIILCKNYKQKHFKVHRLVGIAFIPNPENKPEINHKDGNKSNNTVENLEWNTKFENMKHSFNIIGNNVRKPIIQFNKNGNFIKSWNSASNAGYMLKIYPGNISKCCRGNLKSAGGYVWKYK